MGYRTYIGYLSRKEYNEIKSFTHKQLCDYKKVKQGEHIGHYDIVSELYEFGKETEFDNKKFYKPFWTDAKRQKRVDGDFWVVEKDFLKHIIEHYKGKILSYYDKLLDCPATDRTHEKYGVLRIKEDELKNVSSEKLEEWFNHIRDMRAEWTNNFAFDMTDKEHITHSWKYEYSIFELVRIYKTFNWEKNVMVYYGY